MGKVSLKEKRAELKTQKKAIQSKVHFTEEVMTFFRSELDIDVVAEYRRLKSVGKLPADKLMDRVALSKEINKASENARQANKIFLKAKAEREYFRIEFDRKMRDLNRRATEQVEVWKKENKVSKQTTKDMVTQELASDPELEKEYRTLIEKQEELRGIRGDCELLASEWAERKWTLRTQAQLVAAEKEIKLPNEEEEE